MKTLLIFLALSLIGGAALAERTGVGSGSAELKTRTGTYGGSVPKTAMDAAARACSELVEKDMNKRKVRSRTADVSPHGAGTTVQYQVITEGLTGQPETVETKCDVDEHGKATVTK